MFGYDMSPGQALFAGSAVGTGIAIGMLIAVWLSGATFGQRCEAKGYVQWSAEWERCVGELSGRAIAEGPASASPGHPTVTTAAPSPAPTVTVWQAQPAPEPTPSWRREPSAGMELVHVVVSPATGGDPSMDYCFSYAALGAPGSDDDGDGVPEAALRANAPAHECGDFLFSTHPWDMGGVWEMTPPDCSDTPGGRLAYVSFAESTTWYGSDAYTCLLFNGGA